MARWLCNSPLPGAELKLRGLVKTGMEFSTPDDPDDPYFEKARQSWIPLDAAAKDLVAQKKKEVDELNKQRAKEIAERRQLDEDARTGNIAPRGFETLPNQIEQQFGLGVSRSETIPQDEEAQKRNKAWTKQVRKDQGKEDSDETQAAQDVVREHIALANAAAAQPVADPSAVTGAADKTAKKK